MSLFLHLQIKIRTARFLQEKVLFACTIGLPHRNPHLPHITPHIPHTHTLHDYRFSFSKTLHGVKDPASQPGTKGMVEGLCLWGQGDLKYLQQLPTDLIPTEGEGSPKVDDLNGHQLGLQRHQRAGSSFVVLRLLCRERVNETVVQCDECILYHNTLYV